ncbi:hypothetical protein KIN34_05220 [Cellulomonas sp. DKR-3]|uniref:Uncharacterized protein n=1 Tax=Cellulomonas fulva TaxID=2835530 RepID=A0ABS5TX15_9CELL|nr:hypothetical protein [Cellulomonas fulva]MBT0993685.1 hypothetical protein [Cellulomonas fulva]
MAPLDLSDLRPDRTVDPHGLESARALLDAHLLETHPSTADQPEPHRTGARLPDGGRVDELASRRRRGAVRIGLVGAAAAAAAVVAVALPNPTDSAAFAGWTAVPAQLSAADLAAAGEACQELRAVDQGEDPADAARNLAGARPVLTDRRGATSFTVLASDAGLQSCLIGPHVSVSSIVTSSGSGDSVIRSGTADQEPAEGFSIGIGTASDDVPPGARAATFVGGGTQGYGSSDPWSSAVGRVGQEVRSVDVRLTDGTTVVASVAAGVWAAWWPTDAQVEAVQPTLDDGTAGDAPTVDHVDIDLDELRGDVERRIEQEESSGSTQD